jgi:predicted alpha/beta hydrolase family esterase
MPVLIVPGVHDSEPEHWQSLWEADIPDARRVVQDEWGNPDCDRWLARLAEEIERHPGAILVGHSLGSTLIAHLVQRRPDLPVGGTLLAAPSDPDLHRSPIPGIATFAPLPLAPFPFPAIVVASRTDPYMSIERARVIANVWEATFVDAGEAGHINVASGHGPWPEGRHWLERLRAPRGYLRPSPRRGAFNATHGER